MNKYTIICLALLFALFEAQVLRKTRLYNKLNRQFQHAYTKQGMFGAYEIKDPLHQQFMKQKLDHFNPQETRTWQQEYFVNATHWEAQGRKPILLLLLGGEGPNSFKSTQGHFIINDYAKKHGALIVSGSHRFYGRSNPLPNLSLSSLRYLSTDQALADFAGMRQYIVKKYKMDESKVKVIAFGGSYSGNLAAWIRQKYPHLFDGSLSSSAPVQGAVDFHEYMDVVAASIGPSCNRKLRSITDEVEQKIQSAAGRAEIQQLFKTCDPISMEKFDLATFFMSLADPVCGVVQYNLDNNGRKQFNITQMCSIIEGGAGIQGLANFVHEFNALEGQECVDTLYSKYLEELKNEKVYPENVEAAGRAWTYQTCTEFGYYQYAKHRKQPFSKFITLDYYLDQCQQVFGLGPAQVYDAVDQNNMDFGGRLPHATNVFYSNGKIDPWHFLKSQDMQQPNELMDSTAHCADLYPSGKGDAPELTRTRKLFSAFLDKLLLQQ